MEITIDNAEIVELLGESFLLVIINSSAQSSLGVARKQDVTKTQKGNLTIAGLWPGTALEPNVGYEVKEIMETCSFSILTDLTKHYVDVDAVIKALPQAIGRLEQHFSAK